MHCWGYYSVASLVLVIVGLYDDLKGIRPLAKLAGQSLAAGIVAASGTHFGTIFGTSIPYALDYVMVVIWIVALINAFNLIDGLDGLASGLAIISAVGLWGVFVVQNRTGNLPLLFSLIGACAGFLRYNFHPATIFLGDTGSMFIGLTLGVLSLQTFAKGGFLLSMAIPMLVMGVPLFDSFLAVWRRSVRKWLYRKKPSGAPKRLGVMQADVEHVHHRLVNAGLTTRRVAMLLFAINGFTVGLGLLITIFNSSSAGIFLIGFLTALYVIMRHLAIIEVSDTASALLVGLRCPTYARMKALLHPLWDVGWVTCAFLIALSLNRGLTLGSSWIFEPLVWVVPTFSLLVVSDTYRTIWSRMRLLDLFKLVAICQGGLLISLGLVLMMAPQRLPEWIIRAAIVGACSHPPIILVRLLHRFFEELVALLQNRSLLKGEKERTLVYGTGELFQLLLGKNESSFGRGFENDFIVGLIDEDPSFHGRTVFGYKVLGGLSKIPVFIAQFNVSKIVIVDDLEPLARDFIRDLAQRNGIRLTEWCVEEKGLKAAAEPASGLAVSVGTDLGKSKVSRIAASHAH